MKEFPSRLHADNKDNFPAMNYDRVKAYLRRDLYDHIISREEKDYFELDRFNKNRLNDVEVLGKMVKEVCTELEELGWTTQLSYGGTGLFIYADEPPANCFPDGFD
jgi:hypothetical protein